ncbi:MAG: hypothetical protein HY289_08995 [Planctomycetes bacterium]|nr:hypothetical protein [Planctomycetota bacterium]
MPEDRIQEDEPNALKPLQMPGDTAPETMCVFCPHCFRPTDSLKSYLMARIIFLFVGLQWSYETVVGCPSCMRKAILMRTLKDIVLANLLFPIVAFFYLWQYVATFAKGHNSEFAAAENRRRLEDRFRHVEDGVQLWSWPSLNPVLRFAMLVLIASLLLPVIFLGVGLGMWLFGK